MRFVVDAQLPPALARMLTDQGYIADHVSDIGLRDSDDASIWRYALKHQAVIVTKDEDFPHRSLQSVTVPAVVWLRIGNTSRRALLQWFATRVPEIVQLLKQGERLIEVR